MTFRPKDVRSLQQFEFERLLNEDPITHSLTLLGTFPEDGEGRLQAIVRIEKTALSPETAGGLLGNGGLVQRAELVGSTDIYTWMFAWLGDTRERDVKINIICPATEVHIRKYAKQEQIMVRETAEMYEEFVKPYIASFPTARTQWVDDILSGKAEADKVLYSDGSFVILPDMKWDLTTVTSLYLLAITRLSEVRSLRDLRGIHVGMLCKIRDEAARIGKERWGVGKSGLRMFVHYQPSYYRFHVHIVNANMSGLMGMAVGQAHLLDDIISLLERDEEIFRYLTLSYTVGDQHALVATT